ncbi:hypothetical protein NQ318_016270 [Aromia moschata]|uniref:Uncharacterized protein n=1 Tax=Aromia moschata TaxID=1265417 RepID=A0AAV8Y0W1_9CUCU|nr:hypothetical protein NQ318_016270 [Aromia moschata]
MNNMIVVLEAPSRKITSVQKYRRGSSENPKSTLTYSGLWREVEAIVGVDDRIFLPTSTDCNLFKMADNNVILKHEKVDVMIAT